MSSFFVGAQTVVRLSQTTQIKQGTSFIATNNVYTSTNKTTIVWIKMELFFYPGSNLILDNAPLFSLCSGLPFPLLSPFASFLLSSILAFCHLSLVQSNCAKETSLCHNVHQSVLCSLSSVIQSNSHEKVEEIESLLAVVGFKLTGLQSSFILLGLQSSFKPMGLQSSLNQWAFRAV